MAYLQCLFRVCDKKELCIVLNIYNIYIYNNMLSKQSFTFTMFLQAITDVKYAGRFVGEWGDIAITLSDKTIVEIKSVPKFREISKYCLQRVEKVPTDGDDDLSDTGIVSKKGRGFGTS